jgi:hypothetical protein
MTEQELKYLEKELGLPALINLYKIKLNGFEYFFCSDFRLNPVWWNSVPWLYAPLVIDEYRFSEDNASATPTLSMINLASLYSEVLASLPEMEGADVTYYQVYETEIKESALEVQSSAYAGKFKFKLVQLLNKSPQKMQYRIDPVGFLVNQYAPSRVILRDGIFNLSFPGAGEGYRP